jgi:hypothetical protein
MAVLSRIRPTPSWLREPCIPNGPPGPALRAGFAHEIKHDGYRLVARLEGRRVRLFSRRGYEWSDRFPRIREALASLGARSITIDELVLKRPFVTARMAAGVCICIEPLPAVRVRVQSQYAVPLRPGQSANLRKRFVQRCE